MLTEKTQNIINASRASGWVLEPDAKTILSDYGITVPTFQLVKTENEALEAAREIGFPLAAKVVSPKVLHKSDVDGVAIGIRDEAQVSEVYQRFSQFDQFVGVHLEEMAAGVELIMGAKIDYQFGPVVLLGIGGTGVEIYKDTVIRMAPVSAADVPSMVESLEGRQLIEGYRGKPAVNMKQLEEMIVSFSRLVVDLADRIESIDLNPVMCTAEACVVADARIILAG